MGEWTSWGLTRGEQIAPRLLTLDHLGGGEVYETYLAWDSERYTAVVAKLLRPGRVDDPWARRAIAAEAELLASLSHPFIVRSFGADVDGERPLIVLEHLEGPTLDDVVGDGHRADRHELLPLVLHLASALHYLGSRQVVHLDVKPENVVMGEQPRLIDFSLARGMDRVPNLRVAVGTEIYMAPEQARVDVDRIGPPTDVWGLGVTLYEAMCGRLPFPPQPDDLADDAPPEQRYPQLVHPPAAPDPAIPAALAELTLACLAADPADRPAPAQVVLALEPLIAELPRPLPGRKKLFYV